MRECISRIPAGHDVETATYFEDLNVLTRRSS